MAVGKRGNGHLSDCRIERTPVHLKVSLDIVLKNPLNPNLLLPIFGLMVHPWRALVQIH